MVRVHRGVVAALIALGTVAVGATPAYAHGAGGAQPTNYKTTISRISPKVEGLRVRPVDFGARLELTYTGPGTVTVEGYDGEPFLRVGRGGVFRNERSPATFLNRSSVPAVAPPARFDPEAPPEWRRVSTGRTVRWHDHRAHWMASEPPDAVKADPWYCQVVIDGWEVRLLHGDRRVTVTGDVTWFPPPRPWRWAAVVAAATVAVVGAGLTRRWPAVLLVALAVLSVTETLHLVGALRFGVEPVTTRFASGVYSFGAIAASAVAAIGLARRPGRDVTPLAFVAGLAMFLAGGVADLATLGKALVPSTLPATANRVFVALALGLGAGVVITAARHLRPDPRPAGPPGPDRR
ncbi:MAG: hypothetical protein KJ056_09670 [Acidimicrobiia bacterium]|nr:hypothetical protein [Acidimicrobiia bacterium]